MKIHVPEHIEILNQKLGGKCFLVGGCVRDSILGREINDYDITSANLPEDIMAMSCDEFQVNPVGIDFGVVQIVVPGHQPVEHATFRSDGAYSDFRRPDSVSYSADIHSDLRRRDFTMNAIAYSISDKKLIDPFFGTIDIASRMIRFVGRAEYRVIEDPLRMMRAVRFVSQLGFEIDCPSWDAIRTHSHLLNNISKERTTLEWFKLCNGHYTIRAISYMLTTGLLDILLPELVPCKNVEQNKYHRLNVYDHSVETFMALTEVILSDRITKVTEAFGVELNIPVLLTAGLLHDCGKVCTKSVDEDGSVHFYDHQEFSKNIILNSRSLRLSAEEKTTLMNVVKLHMTLHTMANNCKDQTLKRRTITRFLKTVGQYVPYVYALTVADLMASSKTVDLESNLDRIEPFISEIVKVYTGFYKVYKEQPLLTGKDLIRLGYAPGREFSVILDSVSDMFVSGEITTFDEAVTWVLNNYA